MVRARVGTLFKCEIRHGGMKIQGRLGDTECEAGVVAKHGMSSVYGRFGGTGLAAGNLGSATGFLGRGSSASRLFRSRSSAPRLLRSRSGASRLLRCSLPCRSRGHRGGVSFGSPDLAVQRRSADVALQVAETAAWDVRDGHTSHCVVAGRNAIVEGVNVEDGHVVTLGVDVTVDLEEHAIVGCVKSSVGCWAGDDNLGLSHHYRSKGEWEERSSEHLGEGAGGGIDKVQYEYGDGKQMR